jgi:hypothetical protein
MKTTENDKMRNTGPFFFCLALIVIVGSLYDCTYYALRLGKPEVLTAIAIGIGSGALVFGGAFALGAKDVSLGKAYLCILGALFIPASIIKFVRRLLQSPIWWQISLSIAMVGVFIFAILFLSQIRYLVREKRLPQADVFLRELW